MVPAGSSWRHPPDRDLVFAGEPAAKRPRQVKKITKGRILMDDGEIFMKAGSPCSTPELAPKKRRTRLRQGGINVAEVQQFSREAAGVIMGGTQDGTPIGLRVQDPVSM